LIGTLASAGFATVGEEVFTTEVEPLSIIAVVACAPLPDAAVSAASIAFVTAVPSAATVTFVPVVPASVASLLLTALFAVAFNNAALSSAFV
jgi:hypothetical protein